MIITFTFLSYCVFLWIYFKTGKTAFIEKKSILLSNIILSISIIFLFSIFQWKLPKKFILLFFSESRICGCDAWSCSLSGSQWTCATTGSPTTYPTCTGTSTSTWSWAAALSWPPTSLPLSFCDGWADRGRCVGICSFLASCVFPWFWWRRSLRLMLLMWRVWL